MTIVTRNKTFDTLRGVAILGVICVHTSQTFPTNDRQIDYALGFGRFGVQLFYFISALTMCYMWDLRSGEANQVVKFYFRRFLRIAPLFWLAIPVYLILNGTRPSYWAPEGVDLYQIVLTVFFLHGFWPDSINSVVPGGWSIAVEMTFYLIFPLLITRINHHFHFLSLAIAAYFFNLFIINPIIINLVGDNFVTAGDLLKDFLYLNFFNQAPIFFVGCYLYGLIKSEDVINYKEICISLVLWIAMAVVAHSILGMPLKNMNFLLVIICEFLFVLFALRNQFKLPALEKLGRNSYAIYLGHFLIINLTSKFYSLFSLDKKGFVAFVLGVVLITLLSYIFSIVSYNLLESKIHNLAEKLTK